MIEGLSMKTIWRYDIQICDEQTVLMPTGAVILDAKLSDRMVVCESDGVPSAIVKADIALWAIVDTDMPAVPRIIYIRGTGYPLGAADGTRHIATVSYPPSLWFHVFDGGQL